MTLTEMSMHGSGSSATCTDQITLTSSPAQVMHSHCPGEHSRISL